jgi:hypothetical protein
MWPYFQEHNDKIEKIESKIEQEWKQWNTTQMQHMDSND